ncbi:hypothetical protein, partial [Streptomyces griseoaurantiacus]|uniref:hypothetical protein n=1 Tax=Streptomyces griseoaurantiacus TaxID=68213 RepID=UPI003461460A
ILQALGSTLPNPAGHDIHLPASGRIALVVPKTVAARWLCYRWTAVRRGQTGMFRERLANGRESMST